MQAITQRSSRSSADAGTVPTHTVDNSHTGRQQTPLELHVFQKQSKGGQTQQNGSRRVQRPPCRASMTADTASTTGNSVLWATVA